MGPASPGVTCEALRHPPEWERVIGRHFLLGFPWFGADGHVRRSLLEQLAHRGPACWDLWGPEPRRRDAARFVSEAFGRAAGWPNPIFVPDDPLELVTFKPHSLLGDDLGLENAMLEIERHLGLVSGSGWQDFASGSTFGQLIDRLLERSGRRA